METLKKLVIQHKWLCISSFIGVFLAFGVASDDADLNFFQAFVSVEVVILIVYFVVLNSKKKRLSASNLLKKLRNFRKGSEKNVKPTGLLLRRSSRWLSLKGKKWLRLLPCIRRA